MTQYADRTDDPGPEPEIGDLVRLIKRWVDLTLRVHAPARVVAFDPLTCKATVRIELLPILDVRGEDVPDIPLVLPMIPVRYARASLGGTTIPLVPGDTGHVSFSDRALAAWLQLPPGVDIPVDPESGRCHDLGDAFFEPGLMTDAAAIAAGPIDMTATVVDGAALVKLGAAAAQPVLLAGVLTALQTFAGSLSAAANIAAVAAAGTALQTALALPGLTTTKTLAE